MVNDCIFDEVYVPDRKRKVWIEHFGKIEKGLCIFNICGNIKCVNYEHLAKDTIQEQKRYYHSIGVGGTRGYHHREDSKEKARLSNTGKKRRMETRLKLMESHKGNTSHLGHKLSDEQKEHVSVGTRKAMSDELVRQYLTIATTGSSNHNWKGDDFVRKYTSAFNKWVKNKIRKRDHYTCQLCGIAEKDLNKKLAIHHINYVKSDTYCLNLIALCCECNCRVNINRWYWTMYFNKLLMLKFLAGHVHKYLSVENIEYINSKLGKPDRKPIVRSKKKKIGDK